MQDKNDYVTSTVNCCATAIVSSVGIKWVSETRCWVYFFVKLCTLVCSFVINKKHYIKCHQIFLWSCSIKLRFAADFCTVEKLGCFNLFYVSS